MLLVVMFMLSMCPQLFKFPARTILVTQYSSLVNWKENLLGKNGFSVEVGRLRVCQCCLYTRMKN